MTEWWQTYSGDLEKLGLLWLTVGVVSLVITLISLPLVIVNLPSDYFVRDKREHATVPQGNPVIAFLIRTLKNIVGVTLVIVGAVLLFIPGQGLLTMLVGLMLTNFPGKFHLEQKLVRRPAILRTLNSIRRRWQRDPLLPPESAT